jgi:hypothetical protein
MLCLHLSSSQIEDKVQQRNAKSVTCLFQDPEQEIK